LIEHLGITILERIRMMNKITVFIVLVMCSFGCAHRLDIYQLPPGSEEFLPSEIGITIPAILKTVEIRVDGNEVVDPDPEFIRFVLQKIRRMHVFSEVNSAEEAGKTKMREKAVKLHLLVDVEVDTHEALNLVKFTATCASLFLLSPVLTLTDDFDAAIQLKAVRYDGNDKIYKTRVRGTNHYPVFGVAQSRRDARAEVMTKTLNSLMKQIMEDIDFYAMED
jgi:hypothetical protein